MTSRRRGNSSGSTGPSVSTSRRNSSPTARRPAGSSAGPARSTKDEGARRRLSAVRPGGRSKPQRPPLRNSGPDFGLLFAVASLIGIGLVIIYSGSWTRTYLGFGDQFYYLRRQLLWLGIGLVGMFVAANFPYWRLRSLAYPILAVSLVLLLVVLIPGVGYGPSETKRWVNVAGFNLQPSEFLKLGLTIFLASLLSQPGRARSLWRGVLPVVALAAAVLVLIMLQPDLGTAFAVAGTVMALLFLSGARVWQLVLLIAAAAPVLLYAIFSAEYRARRFLAFLDPWADPLDTGFHIIQSLFSLGSGGFLGLGLGQGKQKYFYLPEQHTDFIFAVLGEELGFLGTVAVVLIFGYVAWRGYQVALRAADPFGSLLAAGLTSMIVLQAIINVGVVTASLPVTGIPLPFISFGGSSLLFSMTAVGLIVNVSRHQATARRIR